MATESKENGFKRFLKFMFYITYDSLNIGLDKKARI